MVVDALGERLQGRAQGFFSVGTAAEDSDEGDHLRYPPEHRVTSATSAGPFVS
jgi:hypothetical protein